MGKTLAVKGVGEDDSQLRMEAGEEGRMEWLDSADVPAASGVGKDGLQRDVRIDFFRGIVLLLIVLDHSRDNPVHSMYEGMTKSISSMATSWGFCDAAHAFIFLSGLVCGMVYWKLLRKEGLGAAVKKSIRRCAQLYAVHVGVLAACVGLVFVVHQTGAIDPKRVAMGPLLSEPTTASLNALLLTYTPWLMDILKMYIVLLLMLPVMLGVYRWNRYAALGLSCALYVVAQRYPEVVLPVYPADTPWFWNPLGWQLLFFGGVWIGALKADGRLKIPVHGGLFAAAAAVFVTLVILRFAPVHIRWGLVDRVRLAPLQVVSFSVFAYLVMCLARWYWPANPNKLMQAIMQCGANSLPVFACGVVVTYLATICMHSISEVADYCVLACAVSSMLLVPPVLKRMKIGFVQERSTREAQSVNAGRRAVLLRAEEIKFDRPIDAAMIESAPEWADARPEDVMAAGSS